ncbi:MAG: 4Fe-4S binding protein [Bacteroidales bacterium]|nr:4Fe-4S binding protein [Bacteroidales bacterium]
MMTFYRLIFILSFVFSSLIVNATNSVLIKIQEDTQLANDSDFEEEFENNKTSSDDFEEEKSSDNEFGENDFESDEFSEFDEVSDTEDINPKTNWNRFNWAIGILFATFIAGLFVRNEKTKKLRPVFLLAAVVILGFYRGGPGIISSFQNTVLFAIGVSWKWTAIVLFLGVVILTYFQGKVFCGWICYLGAVQEFLYIGKIKILQTEKAQKTMRIIRYVLLAAILIQLIITQSIEWSKIGPFKVIFNLYSPNITGYILLGVLLLSSLFIHRPFCKIVCPAGLIFGWVTKLPGAAILGIDNTSCAGCKTCNTSCQINAITRDDKTSHLDNQECIMCGDCMSDCKIKSIQPFRKGKKHQSQIVLKGIKKINLKN